MTLTKICVVCGKPALAATRGDDRLCHIQLSHCGEDPCRGRVHLAIDALSGVPQDGCGDIDNEIAYRRGCAAFDVPAANGEPIPQNANPYPAGGALATWWSRGFQGQARQFYGTTYKLEARALAVAARYADQAIAQLPEEVCTSLYAACAARAARCWCGAHPERRFTFSELQPTAVAAAVTELDGLKRIVEAVHSMQLALDADQIVSLRRMFATWGEDSRAALATIDAVIAACPVT